MLALEVIVAWIVLVVASALLDRQWLRRARTARGIEVTSQGSAAYAVPSASISNSAP
jgi:hypothetical protein